MGRRNGQKKRNTEQENQIKLISELVKLTTAIVGLMTAFLKLLEVLGF